MCLINLQQCNISLHKFQKVLLKHYSLLTCFSKKWATLVRYCEGTVGKTLSAVSKSPLITAVWYSKTDRSKLKQNIMLVFLGKKINFYIYMNDNRNYWYLLIYYQPTFFTKQPCLPACLQRLAYLKMKFWIKFGPYIIIIFLSSQMDSLNYLPNIT